MNEFTTLPEIKPISYGKVPKKKTVIVVGMGRGGTSLTAAILDALGVAMDGSVDGHFERSEFKDFNGLEERIQYLTKISPLWGAQVMPYDLDRILPLIMNPVLIVVFRDLVAIAQRRESAGDYNNGSVIDNTIFEMKRFHEYVKDRNPMLYLSYERLKHEPEQTIDHICEFLDLPIDNKQKALDRIGTGYLKQ